MEICGKPRYLIGLAGDAASGKDAVASIFVRYGFIHQSTSDILREIMTRRGQRTTRELQTKIANERRQKEGDGCFVIDALQRVIACNSRAAIVISGIYAPGEGKFIKNLGGYVVAMSPKGVSLQDRYNRLVDRSEGLRDQINYNEFTAAYKRENSGTTGSEANVEALIQESDFRIFNNRGKEQLSIQVEKILAEIGYV